MSIITDLHAELATAGRVFFDGRMTPAEREAAARGRFHAAFPEASRLAEENFMTRLYRAEAAEAARMEARREANAAETARRAGLTRGERAAEVAEGLRRLRAGEGGLVGRMIAG